MEDAVWSDVSRFLSDPQVLVDELLAESNDIESRAVAEAERASLIDAIAPQPHGIAASAPSTSTPAASSPTVEFDAIAADVERELNTLDERLAGLEPADDPLDDAVSEDTLAEIRERLAEDYLRLRSGRRSFSCSCAGLRSTPRSPTAAASRSASLSTTASRE